MKIYQHHHIGRRPYQEDALGHNNQAFVVCDGVGGHGNGDLASQTVLDFILKTTQNNIPNDQSELIKLIEGANQKLNALLDEHPEKEGMGTTLIGLFKIGESWFSAHIGDSRLYWTRPGKQIFWHTWDHSFVANLVKMGEISREAARKHPRANEIQKALLANFAGNCTKPEIHPLTQIQEGDLMLLCSDGVTEAWSDEDLINVLFDKSLSTADKAKLIFDKCKEDANDNNTAFVLEWEKEDIYQLQNTESTIEWMSFNDAPVKENVSTSIDKKKWWKFF